MLSPILKSASVRALHIGLASARANAVPMFVLWAIAAFLACAYYFLPGAENAFGPFAHFQRRWGVAAAVANQMVFCGLIPCVFVQTVKRIRTSRPIVKSALSAIWCGAWGAVYFHLYGLQSQMFGSGHGFATLIAKAAFDQFVWSPLVPIPLSAVFLLWMGNGFSLSETRRKCRDGFLARIWLPNLVSSWCVWIPVVFAVYAFPGDLQVQVLGLVSSFWTLMCLQIGKRVSE